jgi:MoaA/NifB/PqqE/SkfB family radical SAM enzyme
MAKGKAQANSNYHTAGGRSVFDEREQDPRYKEYRRQWYDRPAAFDPGPFPVHLDLESTSVCNLRCPFCATTYHHWGPDRGGFMDPGLFRAIIDEAVPQGLCSIKLSLRGEPLLHKSLPQFVRYAKEKGVLDVYFNTNAVLLKGRLAEELLDSGLDRISISFEGITKEVYERHRVGARFEEVAANIRAFRAARDAAGRGAPRIRVQTVLLPELKDSFADYVRFWEPFADEVGYLDARDETGAGRHDGASPGSEGWACPFLWQRLMILWDGTVLPCLLHAVKDFSPMVLGRAGKDRLGDLWRGERIEGYREKHRAGRCAEVPACKACSYREMETKKPAGGRPC